MNSELILGFLADVAANNNREWFRANKPRYDEARKELSNITEELIRRIAKFDPTVANLTPKDCMFGFYRDVRFSPDKSPYKRNFGTYICRATKKSLQGGYYVHFQPGSCFLAAGTYWLPTKILTACRNEIMANIDDWRAIVESRKFVRYFGRAGEYAAADFDNYEGMTGKGFGSIYLKKCPKDFPKDYEYVDYLRMKDYCCWRKVSDGFYKTGDWMDKAMDLFRTAKPVVDFMNAVIADYE
ncbi:MAG: DUF2461 domain-containing protein [Prevotella sp.]|nr:DUF2461 domain-containing protein [Prevotella sp.]